MKRTANKDKDPLKKHATPEPESACESSADAKVTAEDNDNKACDDKVADPRDAELCELKERYVRLLAEYDNFRKRSQKERESLYTEAVCDVAREWLSVIDNFERGLTYMRENPDTTTPTATDGMDRIYQQTLEVMTKLGVEAICCESGTPFDPNLHAAVAHIDDETLDEQSVAQVFQKGYKKGDKILRHTMVQVAN